MLNDSSGQIKTAKDEIYGVSVALEGPRSLSKLCIRSKLYYQRKGKNFTIGTAPSITGTVEKDLLHYMFGLDYATNGFIFGTQFIQKIIFDYDDTLVQYNEFSNLMTFLAAKTFLGETLKLEFFSYFGINNLDAMLRLRTYYDITDGLEWILGTDVFVGDKSGNFGQHYNNNMVYTKLTYSF